MHVQHPQLQLAEKRNNRPDGPSSIPPFQKQSAYVTQSKFLQFAGTLGSALSAAWNEVLGEYIGVLLDSKATGTFCNGCSWGMGRSVPWLR